jgi:TolB-like protein/predicted metal-dependent hydrolase
MLRHWATLLVGIAVLFPRGVSLAADRPRVAILDFVGGGETREYEGLGAAMQSMLTTDLAQLGQLAVVERQRLAALRKEIKFSRSQAADPRTALTLGKLAGATHVVFGSYTIIGKKLRLDCRMVSLPGGQVASTASTEGELEAFFEVSKDLGKKLLLALAITPAPRERAAFSRIHTSDLEAFRRFGRGLSLFEEERFAEAIEALEQATAKDGDFDLARITLEDYRQMIADVKTQAEGLRIRQRLDQQSALTAEQRERQQVAIALADRSRAQGPPDVRLAALYLLTNIADEASPDAFDGRIMKAQAVSRYFAEARAQFPMAPLMPFSLSNSRYGFRRELATLDKDLANMTGEVKFLSKKPRAFDVGKLIEALGLDLATEGATLDQMQKLYEKQPVSDEDTNLLLRRGRVRQMLLELDASTKLFLKAKSQPGVGAKQLDDLARDLETNRALAAALKTLPPGPRTREALMLAVAHSGEYPGHPEHVERVVKQLGAESPPPWTKVLSELRGSLNSGRFERHVLFVDAVPFVPVGYFPDALSTGPRTDLYRTGELRFTGERDRVTIVPARGPAVSELEVACAIDFRVPADQELRRPARDDAQPASFMLAFGMANLQTRDFQDPKTGRHMPVPATIHALAISRAGGVRLIEGFAENARTWTAPPTTLGSWTVPPPGNPIQVTFKKSGKTIEATVGALKIGHKLASEGEGFWGLGFEGEGVVSVSRLRLTKAR